MCIIHTLRLFLDIAKMHKVAGASLLRHPVGLRCLTFLQVGTVAVRRIQNTVLFKMQQNAIKLILQGHSVTHRMVSLNSRKLHKK